ncbi:hypothetical protein L1887_15659 [Cichorium endivia]|nr:hypothetical protein L1887_15659 [Cichorium endivia]
MKFPETHNSKNLVEKKFEIKTAFAHIKASCLIQFLIFSSRFVSGMCIFGPGCFNFIIFCLFPSYYLNQRLGFGIY